MELIDEFTEIFSSAFRAFIGHNRGLCKCKESYFLKQIQIRTLSIEIEYSKMFYLFLSSCVYIYIYIYIYIYVYLSKYIQPDMISTIL